MKCCFLADRRLLRLSAAGLARLPRGGAAAAGAERLHRRCRRSAASAVAATSAATAAAVAAAEELEVLDDDRELAALAAALLVFPGVVLQPAFDEDRLALLAVLVDDLGLLAEGGAVDEQ